MLMSSLGTSIANVGLPTMAQAFDASFQQVQWVVLAYLLAISSLIVSAGRLGDIVGRRQLLLSGLAVFTAASILCGLAPTLPVLVAARAAQGLGAAVMMALTMALIGEAVPKERTGGAMGLLGTMSAIGTALGPSLGGVLIAGFGWRAIFLVSVPLGLLALYLAHRHLPRSSPANKSERGGFDSPGTLLLGLTLGAYALAMTVGRSDFGLFNLALLAAAAAGGFLFVLVEAKVATPLIRPSAFRDRVLSASLATNVLVSSVVMATLVIGPFYLSKALALPTTVVGIVMSVGPVISALSGIPAGRLVDRFGAPRGVAAGLVCMLAGCCALVCLPILFGTWGYIAAIAVLTPGYQLFQAANNTVVLGNVPSHQRGVVSGMLNLSRNLGLMSGAAAMGAVFAFASGTVGTAVASAEAVATGMQITFALAGALMIAALVITVGSRGFATDDIA